VKRATTTTKKRQDENHIVSDIAKSNNVVTWESFWKKVRNNEGRKRGRSGHTGRINFRPKMRNECREEGGIAFLKEWNFFHDISIHVQQRFLQNMRLNKARETQGREKREMRTVRRCAGSSFKISESSTPRCLDHK
jgi:hypothetical protein